MGVVVKIGFDTFPKQGSFLGERVLVCFNYDSTKTIGGEIVRDDNEDPWCTLIRLDDGRFVRAEECQYTMEWRRAARDAGVR